MYVFNVFITHHLWMMTCSVDDTENKRTITSDCPFGWKCIMPTVQRCDVCTIFFIQTKQSVCAQTIGFDSWHEPRNQVNSSFIEIKSFWKAVDYHSIRQVIFFGLFKGFTLRANAFFINGKMKKTNKLIAIDGVWVKKREIFRGSNHFGGISVILSFVKSIDFDSSKKIHDKRNGITQRRNEKKKRAEKKTKVRKVVHKWKERRKKRRIRPSYNERNKSIIKADSTNFHCYL